MKSSLIASIVSLALIGCQPSTSPQPSVAKPESPRISGPYTHKNLTVFLIHGPDTIAGDNYLTLQEAMESKKLVVHETGNVNELAIENVSDQPVFIQSGDIVKGGKQDRTIGTDMIAKAHSGRMPIAAFCVEQGRWTGRGKELTVAFESSNAMVAGNAMKLAANMNAGGADQGKVWASVAENQAKLSENVGQSVVSTASPSSFQLAMESPKLTENTDQYTKHLTSCIDGKADVIGYAFAVNGKISSADVYGSNALFKKLWPKLLQSSAVEAVADLDPSAKPPMVSAEDIQKFLATAEAGKSTKKQVNDRTSATCYDANDSVLIDTFDTGEGETSIRRSYISKPAEK